MIFIKGLNDLKALNGSNWYPPKKALPIRIGSTTLEVPLIKGGFRGIINVGGGTAASLRSVAHNFLKPHNKT